MVLPDLVCFGLAVVRFQSSPIRSRSLSVVVCILQLMRIIQGLCILHPRCKFVCQGFAWPTNN